MKRDLVFRGEVALPALAAAVAATAPAVSVFLQNRDHFTIAAWQFLSVTGGIAAVLTALAGLMLAGARRRPAFPVVVSLLLALAASATLQYYKWSQVFPSDLYIIRFGWELCTVAFFHFAFLAIPFFVAWHWRRWIGANAARVATVLILTELAAAASPLLTRSMGGGDYDFTEYTVGEEEKFTFGSDRNLIVLVVDCMGERICKETIRQFPELAETFRDFTCFDRMESPLPRTMYAVPAMLTGIPYDGEMDCEDPGEGKHAEYLKKACRAENSLFQLCRRQGWRAEGYPYVLQTISYAPDVIDNSRPVNYESQKRSAFKVFSSTLVRQLPGFLHPLAAKPLDLQGTPFVIPAQSAGVEREVFDQTFHRRLQSEFRVGTHPRVFKYLHLQGAHDPVETDENLAFSSETQKHRQLRGSLRNVGSLLRKMRDAGIYDRAMIVVIGDHTERYTKETIAFIKRPGERHDAFAVNSVPCRVADIAPTAAKVCGLSEAGRSLFDLAAQAGDMALTRERSAPPVETGAWREIPTPSGLSTAHPYGRTCVIAENRIVFDYFDRGERLRKLSIIVGSVDGKYGRIAECGDPPEIVRLRSGAIDFPDGTYRVFLKYDYHGEEVTPAGVVVVVPKYLVVAGGKARFERDCPDLPPRPMRVGETIRFEPMTPYPQLELPSGSSVGSGALHFKNDFLLSIRLPEHAEKLRLKIELAVTTERAGELTIRSDLAPPVTRQVREFYYAFEESVLDVPPSAEARKIDLRFEFRPAGPLPERQPSRFRMKVGEIRLGPAPR